jgi:hypothetical protein
VRKIVISLTLVSLPAVALDYGVSGAVSVASYDDPDGANTGVLKSLDFNTSYDLRRRGQRVVGGVGLLRGGAEASPEEVNIDTSGYYVYSEYERRFPLGRTLSEAWLAVGGRFSVYDYSTRYTQTEDGYLKEAFDDRSEQSLEVVGRAGYQFHHGGTVKSFPAVYVTYPITGSVTTYGISYRVSF